jgi:hypothetical protein
MAKRILTVAAFTMAIGAPVSADPSLGFGLGLSFGGGDVDYGVGVRVFSDDEEDSLAASVGVDYMLKSRRIRPTVGAAYLGDNTYIGLDLDLGLDGDGVDFVVGIGGVQTEGTTSGDGSGDSTEF